MSETDVMFDFDTITTTKKGRKVLNSKST